MLSRRTRTRLVALVAALSASAALTACGSSEGASPQVRLDPPSSQEPVPSAPPPTTAGSAAPTTTTAPQVATTTKAPASGRVVVLDPGHNGGNASHASVITKLVPAGRGRSKPCNTTGTATNAGYPEHAFTWDLAGRVRELLTAQGVQVVLTRPDDTGVGPCVDVRAATGNQSGAAAVVSLHADGSTSAGAHGFHVAYSAPPLNAAQGEPSLRLARTLRDGLVSAGFATSTYIGQEGLSARDDLGGLNLSERPTAMVECGNMRNAQEAATLSSPSGRQRYAEAISAAILAYLG